MNKRHHDRKRLPPIESEDRYAIGTRPRCPACGSPELRVYDYLRDEQRTPCGECRDCKHRCVILWE